MHAAVATNEKERGHSIESMEGIRMDFSTLNVMVYACKDLYGKKDYLE